MDGDSIRGVLTEFVDEESRCIREMDGKTYTVAENVRVSQREMNPEMGVIFDQRFLPASSRREIDRRVVRLYFVTVPIGPQIRV